MAWTTTFGLNFRKSKDKKKKATCNVVVPWKTTRGIIWKNLNSIQQSNILLS